MPNIYKTDLKITTDGNLSKKELSELNEKMSEVLTEWSSKVADKGHTVDIGWSWYQHINLNKSYMKAVMWND